jgi:hypothetical protein
MKQIQRFRLRSLPIAIETSKSFVAVASENKEIEIYDIVRKGGSIEGIEKRPQGLKRANKRIVAIAFVSGDEQEKEFIIADKFGDCYR